MRMSFGRWTAVIAASAALSGCSSGSATSPDDASRNAAALLGPTWRLATIEGQPVLDGSTVTATFTSDARVAGSAGCNGYFGGAKAASGAIEIGPLGATLMACAPDGLMAQEARYLGALQAAKTYAVSGGELRLGRSASEVTLVFKSN